MTSTISVGFADELRVRHAETGIGYVAAPVFGRPEAAEAAQLEVMVAGEKGAVAKVRPLLDVIGRRTWVHAVPNRAGFIFPALMVVHIVNGGYFPCRRNS